ncbi:hypothetical protein E1301_Tti010615 [Triplophysa tibetana]|uniref:Uncharacterized protein n=1 Tax=Triplophysa tibetana TaxID=1572043 RepID=A0A5A9PVY8_9TELE|nr:hypothetical protein E1301_Tti010615 [Triplophysa tibetana]
MAPFEQAKKSTQTPKDLPKKKAITSKQKSNKNILTEKNHLIFDDRQTSNDRRKEELFLNKKSVHNAESCIATTEVTSFVNTEMPQSKWSAKRRKERERLEQLAVLQKSINYTSVSDHKRDKSFHEMSNGQEKGASQTNGTPTKAKKKIIVASLSEPLSIAKSTTSTPAILKSPKHSSEWSLCGENPKLTVMAEIEPNAQSSDLNLVSRVEELKALTFFTSKTSVWDHIKGSLYYKRSCHLLMPCPVLGIHKASDFETKSISVTTQLSKKLENTNPFTPSVHFSGTSIQPPMEDVHSSRLQSVRSLGWNPEIMVSFRILFSTEPFRNSNNDNMWKKHLFSEPTSHSEGDA